MPPLSQPLGLIMLLVAGVGPAGGQAYFAGDPSYRGPQAPATSPPAPANAPPAPAGSPPAAWNEQNFVPAAVPPGAALAPPDRGTALPLAPPNRKLRTPEGKLAGGLPSAVTVAGSLGLVLGIFLLVVWGMRRAAPATLSVLPGEVFQVLGRAPLAGRQQVHLLRCGSKLLLVSVTPAGTETLTEISDPLEVDRLAGLCQQSRPHSATAAFRQVLEQFGPARPQRGFLGDSSRDDFSLAGAGVPAAGDATEGRHV